VTCPLCGHPGNRDKNPVHAMNLVLDFSIRLRYMVGIHPACSFETARFEESP
jgi:hypothetical protein